MVIPPGMKLKIYPKTTDSASEDHTLTTDLKWDFSPPAPFPLSKPRSAAICVLTLGFDESMLICNAVVSCKIAPGDRRWGDPVLKAVPSPLMKPDVLGDVTPTVTPER